MIKQRIITFVRFLTRPCRETQFSQLHLDIETRRPICCDDQMNLEKLIEYVREQMQHDAEDDAEDLTLLQWASFLNRLTTAHSIDETMGWVTPYGATVREFRKIIDGPRT